MTRRERHIRIIESWGPASSFAANIEARMQAKLGLAAYTDEAIEEFASMLVSSDRFQKKLNAENRARRLASAGSVECPHCHWGIAPSAIEQHIREKH